jgi:hypothetical protein
LRQGTDAVINFGHSSHQGFINAEYEIYIAGLDGEKARAVASPDPRFYAMCLAEPQA